MWIQIRWAGWIRLPSSSEQLYLSGVWLGVDLRMETAKARVKKELNYVLNICWVLYVRQSTWLGENYITN